MSDEWKHGILKQLMAAIEQFEYRLNFLEKSVNAKWHGRSGYTRGCRCDVCTTDKMKYMKELRKNEKNRKLNKPIMEWEK